MLEAILFSQSFHFFGTLGTEFLQKVRQSTQFQQVHGIGTSNFIFYQYKGNIYQ